MVFANASRLCLAWNGDHSRGTVFLLCRELEQGYISFGDRKALAMYLRTILHSYIHKHIPVVGEVKCLLSK